MNRITAALGLTAALALPPFARAQQAPATAPVPAWAVGKQPGAPNLAPHAPRLTMTPADQVPTAALRVPDGFKVELWASGIPGARMMTQGPGGTVFVGTRTLGRVYAVSEAAGGGPRQVRTIAQQLNQPNVVAVKDGNLYVVAINRVLRYDSIEGKLDAPGQPVDLTQAFALPTEEHHGWKFASFGPDGRL